MDGKTTSCIKDNIQKSIFFQYNHNNNYEEVKNFTSSNCLNTFTIPKVPRKYKIVISVENFEPQTLAFEITEQTPDTLDLDEIYLSGHEIVSKSSKEKELDGVTITGIRQKYITVDPNKTSYSVKDNDFLSGGSTEDALKKLPGVIRGYGGELTVNGKSMAIYMDNSPTGLSGDDLENLLQSIPASSIEKIEIINNPGASYEANTAGGIINIVTNGRALRGLNGSITLNYRFNKNNRISPSISLNTRIKKVSLQLNTGFNYREWDRYSTYNREFTYFTPSILFNQETNQENYNRFYFFRPSANIKLNDKSNLWINYNFSYTNNSIYYTGESNSNNSISPIHLLTNSEVGDKNSNNEIIVKYKTQLDSLGRNFDITAYYSYFDKTTTNGGFQNNLGTNLYSLNKVGLYYANFYVKPNLEIPLKKIGLTLNAGGKYSIANSHSLGKYNLLNPSPISFDNPDYKNSLDFNYDDYQYALYAEATKNIGKLSITAGLRYEGLQYKTFVEQTNRKTKNNLDQLYPSASLLYKLNPIVNLNASYRKSISLPPYSTLDPNITGYFDEFNTSSGNPYLQPDFYDNYEVSISAFNYLKLNFQYTYSKHINMRSFETADNSLIVNQTTRTYNGMNNYNISLGIPLPFQLITQGKNFFKNPINPDKLSFIYFYGMYNFYKLNDYSYPDEVRPIWFYNFYSQIVLPKDFKLTLFYMFSTDKGYFRIYKADKSFNYSNVELSRTFYNKALRASFGVDNLFNSNRISATMFNHNLNTSFYQRDDYQTFYFKLSYNFGRLRNLKKENTIIENEKKPENDQLVPATPLK